MTRERLSYIDHNSVLLKLVNGSRKSSILLLKIVWRSEKFDDRRDPSRPSEIVIFRHSAGTDIQNSARILDTVQRCGTSDVLAWRKFRVGTKKKQYDSERNLVIFQKRTNSMKYKKFGNYSKVISDLFIFFICSYSQNEDYHRPPPNCSYAWSAVPGNAIDVLPEARHPKPNTPAGTPPPSGGQWARWRHTALPPYGAQLQIYKRSIKLSIRSKWNSNRFDHAFHARS